MCKSSGVSCCVLTFMFILTAAVVCSWNRVRMEQSEAARLNAVQQLASPSCPDGSFVLRESSSQPGCFGSLLSMCALLCACNVWLCAAMSVKAVGEVTHFLIEPTRDDQYKIKDAQFSFPSLEDLIEYHSRQADGALYSLLLAASSTQFLFVRLQACHVSCAWTIRSS